MSNNFRVLKASLIESRKKFYMTCKENDIPMQFRVLDAPNSVWQDCDEGCGSGVNEEYRIHPGVSL